MEFVNKVYRGLLAGGNLFGYDIAEPWTWAQAKRPIISSLLPYTTGTVTLTADSASGTFGTAPTVSLDGYYLILEGQEDVYQIVRHSANATAMSIDLPYLYTSGTYNYKAIKLDYSLTDDTIVINSLNNKIDFNEGGSELTATLTSGVYTPTTLCAEIKTALEIPGAATYTVVFNSITRKFKITTSGVSFSLLFGTGTNVYVSASETLRYDCTDLTGATFYESQYSLSDIMRITKPISIYRDSNSYYQASKDSSKIFMIDDNTFLREFPISRMVQEIPDKFCIISQDLCALWTARFNAYVDEDVRFEVGYIPVHRKLFDNVNSYPVVPEVNCDFLVYGAAFHLLTEKSDSKAGTYADMAKAQLKALLNDNRKGLSLGGQNYGRFIARQSNTHYGSIK